MITIREHGFRQWFYRNVPGKYEKGLLRFDRATVWDGIYWNWKDFQAMIPLFALFTLTFWKDVLDDHKRGFKACDCGKTWVQYRLMPALLGHKINGAGC